MPLSPIRLGVRRTLCIFFALFLPGSLSCQVQETKRLFTPLDDVGLAGLVDEYERGEPIVYSPDGRYFSLVTEKGLLAQNAVEDVIWIFDTQKIKNFLQHRTESTPSPVALVRMASEKNGAIIQHVRWSDDSSEVAFVAVKRTQNHKFRQLLFADVKTGAIKAMTPDDQDVLGYDVRGANYIYEVTAPENLDASPQDQMDRPVVLTERDLSSILFPPPSRENRFDAAGLWAVINGVRHQIIDQQTSAPIRGTSGLALSPDGNSLVAVLKVEKIPAQWKSYKEPPIVSRLDWPLDANAYHLIDLRSSRKELLVNAPTGRNQHFWNTPAHWFSARWSGDGKSVLLSNTFLPVDIPDPAEKERRQIQPCTAVVRLATRQISCVLPIKGRIDKARYTINDLRFEDDRTVVIDFDRSYFLRDEPKSAVFHQNADGLWQVVPGALDPATLSRRVDAQVLEDINQPPIVVGRAGVTDAFQQLWNPNPQLQDIILGEVETIRWKDPSGFQWECGLVKPPNFVEGQRYPLVIQTHGFSTTQFLTNGSLSTAFAARSLAAVGFVVLQMPYNASREVTSNEGPDQIAGFRTAVKTLVDKGMVAPSKVGIIGFSRTVYHVLEALTNKDAEYAAASVTDGITESYFQYTLASESEQMIQEGMGIYGSSPFARDGIRSWIDRAPGFNMYKVNAPLLLVQPGKLAVLSSWEIYSALRSLKKPVDLIMLRDGTHVMTNPRQRLESESINVDWFRFWLKGEEDPDPAKAEQYKRWRELRKLQEEKITNLTIPGNSLLFGLPKDPTFCCFPG